MRKRPSVLKITASLLALLTLLTLLVILSLWPATAQAQPGGKALDVSRADPEVPLGGHFFVLKDPTGKLALNDVMAPDVAARFEPARPAGDALGFAYTQGAVWLRLHLHNSSDQPVRRMLEISYAMLAKVDIHQADNTGGPARTTLLGYSRPWANQPHPSRFMVMPLDVPARATQVLHLRIETPNSMNVPASLWEPAAFHQHEHTGYAVQALYFGVVVGLVLYNLMLFLTLRDPDYLLYVLFGCCVGLGLAWFNGLAQEYLWRDSPRGAMMGVNVSACLAGVFILLFTRRVLGTAASAPRIDQLVTVFLILSGVSLVGLLFWFQAFTPVFIAVSALTSLFLLWVGAVYAWRRQRSGYYFVTAFGVMLAAVTLAQLRNLGVMPTNLFTSDGTQIGSAIEMLLLAFALADRYHRLRQENVKVQAQALHAQMELVRTLQVSEQELETRVQERTAELHHLNQRLEAMNATDGLTGIANRRRFDAVLAIEWERARRMGQELAIGLLDVDWFKSFNDHYGHLAGDECLRKVAEALAQSVGRTGDLVARYGGEEFVFVAPATPGASALAMARRVCEAIEALGIRHQGSAFGQVTVSIGVATAVPAAAAQADTLLQSADQALYRAKANGRNRVDLAGA